jgi:hypothetical protein
MEIPAHYLNRTVVCVSCCKNFIASNLEQLPSRKSRKDGHVSTVNDDKVWTVGSLLNPRDSMDRGRQSSSVILMLPASMRQGSILGGYICLAVGIAVLFLFPNLFLLYLPLFVASFTLSIIALAQRSISGGIGLLLATLIIPWFVMGLSFVMHAKLQERDEYRNLLNKKSKFEDKLESMRKFKIIEADLIDETNSLGISSRMIKLTVINDTDQAVSRVFFRGVLSIPDRSIPIVDDEFNYQIRGGIEPGERVDWVLEPNMFGEWARAPIHYNAEFTVTVVGLEDSDGNQLFDDLRFSKYDQKRLNILSEKFSK